MERGRKNSVFFLGIQASPPRLSGEGNMKVKALGLLEVVV